MKHPLKITPIGGLGEIGMNMLVIECDRRALVIDCGVMFPDQFYPGIDLVLPSLDYVLKPDLQIEGIVLTHGHEDHIGALPYLLRKKQAPIYGSKFTLELVKSKLGQHNLLHQNTLELVKEGDHVEIGPYKIEFIEMSHSICDALGMCIDTPQGRIIHTGDFKLESDTLIKRRTNIERFKELGKEGVDILLSDSTNVEVPGFSSSEKSVQEGLKEILDETKGWFIISSFASHIPRIAQVIELAEICHRKILILGRSMQNNVGIAKNLGYLKFDDTLIVNEDEAMRIPRNQLIVLSTGSQGEPRAALARMAMDQFRNIKLMKGDNVVLSSRFIPGNEKSIYGIMNNLYRRGAEVYTSKGSDVHVSGHGFAEDLRTMILAVNPKYFIPIHGEFRHLQKHLDLAAQTCVDANNVLLLEDGEPVELLNGKCKRLKPIELHSTVVMENEVGLIGEDLLKDRRKLAYCGAVSVVAVVDKKTKALKNDIQIHFRGVVFSELEAQLKEGLLIYLEDNVFYKESRGEKLPLSEQIHRGVKRFFKEYNDRKPVVFPVVIEV